MVLRTAQQMCRIMGRAEFGPTSHARSLYLSTQELKDIRGNHGITAALGW